MALSLKRVGVNSNQNAKELKEQDSEHVKEAREKRRVEEGKSNF